VFGAAPQNPLPGVWRASVVGIALWGRPKREVANTRHVIGYLCCLVFITFVMTFFRFFPDTVRNIEANTTSVLGAIGSDPAYARAFAYTVHIFGVSFSPPLVLGHLLGIILSPIGLFALLFYFVLNWMLPVR
jgi:hypothetical protein